MEQVKAGDTVKVHYTGKLEDGTVFDSSVEDEPLEFTVGSGTLIPGFEQAVVGMAPGETKTEKIPADEAYGPYQEAMVMQIDRNYIPEDFEPEVGQHVEIQRPSGEVLEVTIIDITESAVTLDANHPLAGMDLIFEIELLEIA